MLTTVALALALVVPVSASAVAPAVAAGAGVGVPGAAWSVESPAAHGMDAATLDGARTYAFADGRHTQGVVVVRGGAIVSEWYEPGAGPTSWAASWSMAKSFTSALIGIAIGEGRIPSIDVKMTTYYPQWIGTPRESITLRDVLHMESGLDWDENYDPSSLAESEIIAMVATQSDQLAFAASIPAARPPATAFNYSSGDSMLLSGVIQQATGMSAEAYAHQKLLDPIGMSQVEWWRDADGHTLTYCCFDTTSRDFARFGLLYLHGGNWGGQQVVPLSWVNSSLLDTAATYQGYGYQWWLDLGSNGPIPPYFSARGHDGQYIYVIPSLDLVVVRNGTYVKSPCPAVADPALLAYYPPSGLVPGQGTTPPDSWDDVEFLSPIVASITGQPLPGRSSADAGSAAARGDGIGVSGGAPAPAPTPPAPCPTHPVEPPAARPISVPANPSFTG